MSQWTKLGFTPCGRRLRAAGPPAKPVAADVRNVGREDGAVVRAVSAGYRPTFFPNDVGQRLALQRLDVARQPPVQALATDELPDLSVSGRLHDPQQQRFHFLDVRVAD